MVQQIRVWLTDILGGVLIIASVLLGWIPGPGGIPLFLAGLSLLAINHKWARDLLTRIRAKGQKVLDSILKDNWFSKHALDLLGAALVIAGFLIAILTDWAYGLIGLSFAIIGAGLILGGEDRLNRINRFIFRR